MNNDDNIVWCPYWQPGRNIKKCNWCLDLERKVKKLEKKLLEVRKIEKEKDGKI